LQITITVGGPFENIVLIR